MDGVKFLYLDKSKADEYLEELFEILHSNMSLIAPTGNLYKQDFEMWSSAIIPALEKEQRQFILMYVDNLLVGYFQYYINIEENSLMMEEIQIKIAYQGTGLFSVFFKWFLKQFPKNIMYVEAFANKKNLKSQAILKYLGLVCLGENKNGNSFFYKGDYADLLSKYNFDKNEL